MMIGGMNCLFLRQPHELMKPQTRRDLVKMICKLETLGDFESAEQTRELVEYLDEAAHEINERMAQLNDAFSVVENHVSGGIDRATAARELRNIRLMETDAC